MVGIMAGTTHTTIGIVRIDMIGIMVGITHIIGVGAVDIHTITTTTITTTTITIITRIIRISHIVLRMADRLITDLLRQVLVV